MNGAVCGFGAFNRPKYKISQFNPSAYVQWEPKVNKFGNVYAYNRGLDASQKPENDEGIGNRHGNGAGILGFDSRVRWISLTEVRPRGEILSPTQGGLPPHCTPKVAAALPANSGHGRGRRMIRDQLLDAGLQSRQDAFNPCALLGAEPVKRLGHEVVANPLARQGAFDSLDDR